MNIEQRQRGKRQNAHAFYHINGAQNILLRHARDIVVHKRHKGGDILAFGAVLRGEGMKRIPAHLLLLPYFERIAHVLIQFGKAELKEADEQKDAEQFRAIGGIRDNGGDQPAGDRGDRDADRRVNDADEQCQQGKTFCFCLKAKEFFSFETCPP